MAATKEHSKYIPAYLKLRDTLQQGIENGEFPPGGQIPSEENLSRQYGIHRHTVRRSLRSLEDAGLIISLPGRGWFVRKPDEEAVTPAREILGVYGLELFYLHQSPSTIDFLNELMGEARQHNIELHFLCDQEIVRLNEDIECKVKVDYLLFRGANPEHYPLIERLKERGVKILISGRQPYGINLAYTAVDNYFGAREVVSRLVLAGHRKIGFIGSGLPLHYVTERWRGFCDALHDAGINPELSRVLKVADYSIIRQTVGDYLDVNWDMTALYLAGEVFHCPAFEYLFQHQIQIPEAISIGAFDKVDMNWSRLQITTAEQPTRQLIAEIFQQIQTLKNGGQPVCRLLLPDIIDGQSIKEIICP